MKVLQVGDNSLVGRRFAGHNLNTALRSRGIESEHVVWLKNVKDNYTHEIANQIINRNFFRDFITQINSYYGSHALFYPFSYDLFFDPSFLEADVVHLHLIHNYFFDFSLLPLISRLKPTVITFHDTWPLQGHCIYPLTCERWKIGCGECPDLKRFFETKYDTTALNWEYKNLIFQASDLDVIVASDWVYDKVSQSQFVNKENLHLVNYGISTQVFKPIDKSDQLKAKFGIPLENVVIAFRGSPSMYKGCNFIKECLSNLSSNIPLTLLILQEKDLFNEFREKFQIVELGWVDDDNIIVDIYNAADIFLMPSVGEAFGMMALEAMSCGKPVIVMDGTSLPGVVKPEESGCIVVPQGDVNSLRTQLENLISDTQLRSSIGIRSRQVAQKYYEYDLFVDNILLVYQKAITRKNDTVRAEYIIDQQKKIELKIPTNSMLTNQYQLVEIIPNMDSGNVEFAIELEIPTRSMLTKQDQLMENTSNNDSRNIEYSKEILILTQDDIQIIKFSQKYKLIKSFFFFKNKVIKFIKNIFKLRK